MLLFAGSTQLPSSSAAVFAVSLWLRMSPTQPASSAGPLYLLDGRTTTSSPQPFFSSAGHSAQWSDLWVRARL